MYEPNANELRSTIIEFLEEAYDGPKHEYTWFIGNDPNSGFLGTIRKITCEEASTPIVKDGTTIAAHVGHLLWTLEIMNALLRDEDPTMNWNESWTFRNVNSPEWEMLIKKTSKEYETLIIYLKEVKWRDMENFKVCLALIPHSRARRVSFGLGSSTRCKMSSSSPP